MATKDFLEIINRHCVLSRAQLQKPRWRIQFDEQVSAAKGTLSKFLALLSKPLRHQKDFLVLVSDNDRNRWFRCVNEGLAFNTTVPIYRDGVRTELRVEDILDWAYLDAAILIGGFTLRPRILKKSETLSCLLPFLTHSLDFAFEGPEFQLMRAIAHADSEEVARLANPNQIAFLPAAQPNWPDKREDLRVLSYSVWWGTPQITEQLINAGYPVNAFDKYGIDALRWAALKGDIPTADVLLKCGAEVDSHRGDQRTALEAAVGNSNIEMIKFLVERGANPTMVFNINHRAGNALHFIGNRDSAELVRLLISYGVDVNYKDKKGESPLHVAVINGYRNSLMEMVKSGGDLSIRDADGKTVAERIAERPGFDQEFLQTLQRLSMDAQHSK